MNATKKFAPLLAAALCLALGCGKGDDTKKESEPAPGPETKNGEPPKLPDGTPGKPDFVLTSKEFGEEYKKDETAAEAKYKGKTIELTGVVESLGRNLNRESFLSLGGAEGQFLGVMCFTKDPLPWARAAPGQTVKLRGKGPDFSGGAALVECQIVEVTGPPPPSLTAEELATEHAKDPEGTEKKYKDKYLIVSGEIVNKETNDEGVASIFLKTGARTKVKCVFTGFDKAESEPLKIGQKVKVLGEFSTFFASAEGNEAALGMCHLVEPPK